MNWFLVVGENAGSLKPVAYADADEAHAMCRAKNYEYPALGPWEVVPVAEVREAVPVSQTEEE
jgi:hypothetical protein